MSDLKPQFKGLVGVFLVCGELSSHNLVALPTSRNTEGYDIVVLNPTTKKAMGIQVKCTDRKDFPVISTHFRDYERDLESKIFCPFVCVNISDWIQDRARPSYFILSDKEMKQVLKRGISTYLCRYEKRHNLSRKQVLEKEEIEKRNKNLWALKWGEISDYKDKWETITAGIA